MTTAARRLDTTELQQRVQRMYVEVVLEPTSRLADRSPNASATPQRIWTASPPPRSTRSQASGTSSTSPESSQARRS